MLTVRLVVADLSAQQVSLQNRQDQHDESI
jgi:hypothetical protein